MFYLEYLFGSMHFCAILSFKTISIIMRFFFLCNFLPGCFLFFSYFTSSAAAPCPPPPFDTIKLEWINYGPYTEPGQNPNKGTTIGEAQIIKHLDILRHYAKGIRIFGTEYGLEKIPRLAKERGLKVMVGIWIGRDTAANNRQIANGVAIAKAGYADMLIVGSEVLLRRDVSAAQLLQYINQVKTACPNIPVSCADVYSFLCVHPEIITACTYILINNYPYWEGVHIDCAIQHFDQSLKCIKSLANGKEIIISETGWKTKPPEIGNAEPTAANAVRYLLEVLRWQKATGIKVCIFSAFDEPWKGSDDGWGILNINGTVKPGMDTLFRPVEPLDLTTFCKVPPSIGPDTITHTTPALNTSEIIRGRVNFYNPCDHVLVMYIKVDGIWWSKPTFAQPYIPISCTGEWSSQYATGGNDQAATEICLFLVPKNYTIPICGGCATLPAGVIQKAIARKCITRYALTNTSVTASKDSICTKDTVTLEAKGGRQYLWSTGDTTATIKVTPQSTTIYWVTIRDGNGGSSVLLKRLEVISFNPSASAVSSGVCAGNSIMLQASGGTSYQWSPGATTQIITVTPQVGNLYTVTISNTHICRKVLNVSVQVHQPDATIETINDQPITSKNIEVCKNAGVQTLSPYYPGGNWSSNALNGRVNPNNYTAGTVLRIIYRISLNGCPDADTLFITIKECPSSLKDAIVPVWSASPNPFNDYIQIAFKTLPPPVFDLFLYDIQGRIVATTQINAPLQDTTFRWNITKNIPKGAYLLKLQTQNIRTIPALLIRQ